ncbi:hypothetical protein ERJ75_000985100 [Trypanosoma vivax]|uniref:COP9 signalosome complex subunit 3 N-terminal helical repeats domain-containing protein n=1 Tax=Trypanosoma vivax (strain Y486) TaxID=1055687 RepID=G0U6Y9_TRYVY|nr:hypothetical protein TRVL_05660 [Trypanosoma vivax]KAH8611716.1 hypothetical protein ERJ75_000985100 [Trypanosoma vivax]CCC51646.1 conserved hypothetical protein [Trypanosoma vivax Y486]
MEETTGLFDEITAATTSGGSYGRLEMLFERSMTDLIAQRCGIVEVLVRLMEMENGAGADISGSDAGKCGEAMGSSSRKCFAMGMTFLGAALVLSGSAEGSDVARLLVSLVENHLLADNPLVYRQLRGHAYALRRFEQLLKGYVALLNGGGETNNSSKLSFLQRAVRCFAPSDFHLTIAHPLFVREAARCRHHSFALEVMRRPVLEVSPADTGAGIACFCSYYYEGGILLSEMECWDDAAAWLRTALSVSKCVASPCRREIQSRSDAWDGRSVVTTLVSAMKVLILVNIILRGEWSDKSERLTPQRFIQLFRSNDIEPYVRLLAASSQRDGKRWQAVKKHFETQWQQDGTESLVQKAWSRLKRHMVRDIAKVACRVHLSSITAALRSHSVLIDTRGIVPSDDLWVKELLISMANDGELVVSIQNVVENDNEEGHATEHPEQLVVQLALPPKQLPLPLGCRYEKVRMTSSDITARVAASGDVLKYLQNELQRCEMLRPALMQLVGPADFGGAPISQMWSEQQESC